MASLNGPCDCFQQMSVFTGDHGPCLWPAQTTSSWAASHKHTSNVWDLLSGNLMKYHHFQVLDLGTFRNLSHCWWPVACYFDLFQLTRLVEYRTLAFAVGLVAAQAQAGCQADSLKTECELSALIWHAENFDFVSTNNVLRSPGPERKSISNKRSKRKSAELDGK